MPFEFTSPSTIEEGIALYDEQEGAQWFAGGTDLVPEINTALAAPTRLVNLKNLTELRGIGSVDDGVRIGALATLGELTTNAQIRTEYRALAQACELSASPQIRNVATIGGNLCQDSRCPYYRGDFYCYLKGGEKCFMRDGENRGAAVTGYHDCVHVHPSDPANAFVAFDAQMQLRGAKGTRTIAAAEFFHAPQENDRCMNILDKGEFIQSLQLPRAGQNTRSVYLKAMDRATWTFALSSVAVRLEMNGTRIADARVVLGAVAPVPWREFRVENTLRGAELTETLATNAAWLALQGAKPLEHNQYKLRLTRALVKKALLELLPG